MAQLVERLTLDSGSVPDLGDVRLSPMLDSALDEESA